MVKSDNVASAVEQEHYAYRPGVVIHADLYVENTTSMENDADNPIHEAEDPPEQSPISISLTVVQTLSTTLSCVLLVDVSDGYQLPTSSPVTSTPLPSTSKAVLKLCDRRFSAGLREDYDAAIWTPQVERKHRKFMTIPEDVRFACSANSEDDSWRYCSSDEDGSASKSRRKKSTNMAKKKRVSNEHWSSGHREAYIEQVAQKLYRTEVAIYRQLRELQGEDVPFIYGTVRLQKVGRRSLGKLDVRGMLMQYIDPSFSLRDIPERIPDQTRWQEVGEAAVKVVQVVGDYGILNDDVRLDNILVVPTREEDEKQADADSEDQPERSTQRFKTVMIDFGIARAQRKNETDDEFRRERRRCDEEGAVGYVLEKHLMKAKQSSNCPHFKYRPSRRLDRPWDNDEEDNW
ncbi:hypothetical protein NLJ89_g3201 [Agrocybe chaxingu]|uniref:Protein kinase domain-containing protein n=1 Tax=Agrocybe chaxingu TaxID=84603 RepID=A0A9W8MVQ4_9AGAR|nr:hypothetical protein NLJ89_g3201 [Agrocybe chaxingu]